MKNEKVEPSGTFTIQLHPQKSETVAFISGLTASLVFGLSFILIGERLKRRPDADRRTLIPFKLLASMIAALLGTVLFVWLLFSMIERYPPLSSPFAKQVPIENQ